MSGILPIPAPYDRPYWQSGRVPVFQLPRCDACGHLFFPPGPFCVSCGATTLTWTPLSGRGEIWSWVVMHKQYFPAMPPPYIVVRVRLGEGPLLITNLVDTRGRAPWIGAPVRVVFESAGDLMLPQFTFADNV